MAAALQYGTPGNSSTRKDGRIRLRRRQRIGQWCRVVQPQRQGHPRKHFFVTRGARPKIEGGGPGNSVRYLVSLQWPVVQLDFSDGMHMTENSYMPQSARMRAQIQANTGNFGRQRFSLHGVDLTKFDGGGARDREVSAWMAQCQGVEMIFLDK